MKHKNKTHRSKKTCAPSNLIRDVMINRNAVELALCHVTELIGLAQDIASDMHIGITHPDMILHVSGRLGTLMYCAKNELEKARRAVVIYN